MSLRIGYGLPEAGDATLPNDVHQLHIFMAQVTHEIESEYERIYARAAEDPGTAGDEGEENWAALLRDWLPSNYHVATKGRLVDHKGNMSPQVDVLVLKPSYPRKLLEKKIWLANGVAAVFECKTTLIASHVSDSVDRCKKVKSLFEPRHGSPRHELRSPLIYGLLAHSHVWKASGSKPIDNVDRALETANELLDHPRFAIDIMCIADLATWSSMYMAYNRTDWTKARALADEILGPTTAFMCAAIGAERQTESFTPIGALIGGLIQGIAREDSSIRAIADYYRLVNLWGSAQGGARQWPLSVYSDEVRNGILSHRVENRGGWNDWSLAGT